jgi:hypothetical protein
MDKIFIGRRRAGCRARKQGTERERQILKIRIAENFIERSPIRSCAVAITQPAQFTFPIAGSLKRFKSCCPLRNRNANVRQPASAANVRGEACSAA